MAHTITGIDLGSWSVKFSVFDVGFRRVRLHTSFEEIVPPGEAPLAERQAEALRASEKGRSSTRRESISPGNAM